MLADAFENFQNICIEIYELDPAKCGSASGLAWQAVLKKTKAKLDLLTDIDILLMVERGIRGRICHPIYRYTKANNKWNIMIKIQNHHQYWDVNNLYGCAMS